MKKKIFRILSLILICCISFLCVGCMGSSPDEMEGGDFDLSEGMAFDMYGTKVLYRPLNYDYDTGSGAEEGKTNDYYGKYAFQILQALYQIYGITDTDALYTYLNASEEEKEVLTSKLPYFYDSIRYQVDTIGTVTQKIADGEDTTTPLEEDEQYIIVGAKLNSWNWSFNYDLSGIESGRYNAMLFNNSEYADNYYTTGDHQYATFTDNTSFTDSFNNYSLINDFYTEAYLGTNDESDAENYSDYVKALEYVVYSYALDLEPKTITVTVNKTPTSVEDLYKVSIQSYESVDEALTDIKLLFKQIGSYVGLMQRQIKKISSWIKSNIIGDYLIDYGSVTTDTNNDSFTTYNSVTEVTAADGTISYIFNDPAESTLYNLRNYDKKTDGTSGAVDNIVNAVCEYVSIGKESDGGGVNIDDRFLASEVKEYAGNTFFIAGDENFPAPGSGFATAIEPLEYQSVQFMLKEDTAINSVFVALKYDADLDGTEPQVYDLNKYLDIIVELNYYNHAQNKMFTLGSQQTRVYDGPYRDILEEDKFGVPVDDHGTLFFDEFLENCEDKSLESVMYHDGIIIGEYNTEIGNGILKTDVGEGNYLSPLVSQNPLILVGTTDVRKYYSIIEPADDELIEGTTYVTGRANPAMYAGEDGCDYLELTYKVLKKKGDRDTNYKFYTGVVAVFDPFTGEM